MKAFLAALVLVVAASSHVAGQTPSSATSAELSVIDAYVARAVARARHDAPAEAARTAELTARRRALEEALARGERVALADVRTEVARQLADVEARLAEVGVTCGPIADPVAARARRDALTLVRAAVERGVFFGE